MTSGDDRENDEQPAGIRDGIIGIIHLGVIIGAHLGIRLWIKACSRIGTRLASGSEPWRSLNFDFQDEKHNNSEG